MTRTGKILLTTGIVLLLAVPVALKVFRGGAVKQVELATVEQRVITPTILASGSLTYQT
jgi:hypothetical protein